MKVGNLVRRKPHAITNEPEILGLVTEMFSDASAIRITFINPDPDLPAYHILRTEKHWRKASHFEVVS